MQLRCQQCHRPFALGKEAVLYALDMMHKQEMHHYNAQCPHCRRVNRLSQDELLRAAPDWTPSDEQPEQEDVSAD